VRSKLEAVVTGLREGLVRLDPRRRPVNR
jgi:hypothetical protein